MAQSNSSSLLETSDFDSLYEELKAYDEQRELVIKRSRDIGKLSKQAIFSLHRGALDEAASRLEGAQKAASELLPIIRSNPTLRQGSFSAAIEEYAEACAFREYLASGRLLSSREIDLAETEEYLGGVLDFTGELNRYAVARATVRDKEAVQRCRDLVEAIMGQFLRFDLRNGSLRKKFDSIKYTLKKMEQLLYELSLAEAGLTKKPEEVLEKNAAGTTDDARGDEEA
ncbi:hypothetical protein N2152v2_007595 [Parachlorella kessleri]